MLYDELIVIGRRCVVDTAPYRIVRRDKSRFVRGIVRTAGCGTLTSTVPYDFSDEQCSPLRIMQEGGATKEKGSLFQRAFILLLILFKSLS